jgi:hypothetical protein
MYLWRANRSCVANSARAHRFAEDVRIAAIVIAELKFGDVQREIFGADLMERADHAALYEAPKAFNRLSMDRTDDVLTRCMINRFVREFAIKMFVANPLIRAEQANICRNAFAHKGLKCLGANVCDNAGDHVSFALHRASNNGFARSASGSATTAFVPMTVLPQCRSACGNLR